MQLHKPGGRPDYEALAVRADEQAEQAEALHLTALWRELATTYRELAHYHSSRPGDAEPVGLGQGCSTLSSWTGESEMQQADANRRRVAA